MATQVQGKKCKLEKIEQEIRDYNPKYPPAKYLLFIRQMLTNGYDVYLWYSASTFSKYVYVKKGAKIFKIRFSNHKPSRFSEQQNDSDFYVGISHSQVLTTEEVMKEIDGRMNQKDVDKNN